MKIEGTLTKKYIPENQKNPSRPVMILEFGKETVSTFDKKVYEEAELGAQYAIEIKENKGFKNLVSLEKQGITTKVVGKLQTDQKGKPVNAQYTYKDILMLDMNRQNAKNTAIQCAMSYLDLKQRTGDLEKINDEIVKEKVKFFMNL